MFKKIAVGAMLAAVALSQGLMVGGFRKADEATLANAKNDAMLTKAEQVARDYYRAQNNGELGALVELYEQVVAGINYKMIFQTETGQYEATVFAQPWTETYKVTSMKPHTEKKD